MLAREGRSRLTTGFLGIAATATTLLSGAVSVHAQVAGPNRKVISGVVEPGEPEPEIKTDLFLQRQNESVLAPSSVNPDHLLVAANDYRTIDIAQDFGTGEPEPGPIAKLLHRLLVWLGFTSDEPKPVPMGTDAWMGIYRSCNRGQTWVGGFLPGSPNDVSPASLASPLKGLASATDPVMQTAHDGFVYVGGMAFDPGGLSKVFVGRYRDRNNLEGGACFTYELTEVVEEGHSDAAVLFLDKPAIAADIPRDGQEFGNVYLAYTAIRGGRSEIRFAHSSDGGETWSTPLKISDKLPLSQGSAVGLDPRDGTVYVVWRDFITQQIYVVQSKNIDKIGGKSKDKKKDKKKTVKFTKPAALTSGAIAAFDQGTDFEQFRSSSFPTMAVDGSGKLFVAWQERVVLPTEPEPTPRIVLSMSEDGGKSWTPREAVDVSDRDEQEPGTGEPSFRPSGPQVMPALSYSGGILVLTYYEARDPVEFDGTIRGFDRQMDLRLAVVDPVEGHAFSSIQVSEYEITTDDPPRIVEANPGFEAVHRPNLPMFRGGTVPFVGDYAAVVPAIPLVRTDSGWKIATELTDVVLPSFHNVWTDNRNVIFPQIGGWEDYSPAGTGLPSCINPGSRNQDAYTSEVSADILAGSPSIFKPLNETFPRAFVVYVENRSAEQGRFVDLQIVPGAATASFDQEEPNVTLLEELEIFPYSTITRTVFATSSDPAASITVDVSDTFGGDPIARVVLNRAVPDAPLANDGLGDSERRAPRVSNPRVSNPRVSNPRVSNPRVSNPRVSNPRVSNALLPDGEPVKTTDVSFTVINEGNTTTAFNLLTRVPNFEELDLSGKYAFQLLIQRNTATPSAGLLDPTCSSIGLPQESIISNIFSPRVSNTGAAPRVSNPRVSNAAFFLEPASGSFVPTSDPGNEDLQLQPSISSVTVTLRVFQTEELAPGDPVFDPADCSTTVVSQANEVVAGVLQEDPPFASVGPNPPTPLKEVAGVLEAFDVPPPEPDSLDFTAQPEATTAGQPIPPVAVQLLGGGSPIPRTSVPVTLSLGASPGGGTLSGTLTQPTENGVATFTGLIIDSAGIGYTLIATSPGLAAAASVAFDIVPVPVSPTGTTGDSGAGSLREAITDANNNPGLDVITFVSLGPGTHVIAPTTSPLPAFTDPVIIDGTTAVGYAPGAPTVVLDGSALSSGSGLVLSSGGSTVRGLQIINFPGNGIELLGDGNVVEEMVIGTDATGTTDLGNTGSGILVASSNNTIGGAVELPGTQTTEWGTLGFGNGQFGFFFRGVELDPASGDIFVADTGASRVQRFDSDGKFLLKWGRNGGDGTRGSGDGEFRNPLGIAVDSAGDVYVVDGQNHRVQKFTIADTCPPSSVELPSVSAAGAASQKVCLVAKWGANGGDGTRGSLPGEFRFPWGMDIGFDGPMEVVYVMDRDNARVQQFATDGTFLLEWGSLGTGPGQFNGSRGVSVDADGFVYVPDRNNDRVQKFELAVPCPVTTTEIVPGVCFEREWGTRGVGNGEFDTPNEVDFDAAGRVYVTDLGNDRYQVFDTSGSFLAVRGVSGSGPGEFLQTTDLAFDAADNLYIGQGQEPTRVQKFTNPFGAPSSAAPNTIAFNDVAGISVASGTGNDIRSNQIYESPKSIDTGAGPTLPGVPVLTASESVIDYSFTKVIGMLNSTPETTFALDFFYSDGCVSGTLGEAKQFMGTIEITTDFDGAASFTANLPFEAPAAGFASASATAVDAPNNTTELSVCIPHSVAPKLQINTTDEAFRLPVATIGAPYSVTMTAVGGTLPYTWRPRRSSDADQLDNADLTLNSSTGEISGTPSGAVSDAFFDVVVEDSGSPPQIAVQELFLDIVPPGGAISGSVFEAEPPNDPVPFAVVDIFDAGGNFVANQTADANGDFTTTVLAAGTYFASTRGTPVRIGQLYDGVACPGGCDPTAGTPIVIVVGSNVTGIDFSLPEGGSIAGTVTDGSAPLEGVDIVIYEETTGDQVEFDSTGPAGSYTTDALPAGNYFVVAGGIPGLVDQVYDGPGASLPCIGAFSCDFAAGTAVAVSLGATTSGIDIVLPAGATISGGVTREGTATTLEGVSLAVFDASDNVVAFTSTDPSGDYAFSVGLPTGDFFVRARLPGYMPELFDGVFSPGAFDILGGTPVAVTAPGTTTVDFDLTPIEAAVFPVKSEFQVNSYTPTSQSHPVVSMDGSGNFVVAWTSVSHPDEDIGGDGFGAFAQRYGSDGTPLGGEIHVNPAQNGNQGTTGIAMDPDGNFVVNYWNDIGPEDFDVFGQRFDDAGTKLGGAFLVNTYTTNWQEDGGGVAMDADGNFIVVWPSGPGSTSPDGQDGDGWGSFGQRFADDVTPLGVEFQVNTHTTGNQGYDGLDVAMDADGDFVIVWGSEGQDGSGFGIFGQRFGSDGIPAGSEFQVNSYSTGDQVFPSVAIDDGGDFVVVWQSEGQDGYGGGIFGQRYDAAGVAQGTEFAVNSVTVLDQFSPRVAVDGDGDFVVIWSSNRSRNDLGTGVVGQLFEADGTRTGTEFQISSYVGDQRDPSIASQPNGDFVVAWTSRLDQDGDEDGIFAQQFSKPQPNLPLTAGIFFAGGEVLSDEPFNGQTRGVEIRVDSVEDLVVTSMSLDALDMDEPGTVGARIYDSSETLIASGDTALAAGPNQSVTIPLSATLVSSETYRVAFFVPTAAGVNSAEVFVPNPFPEGGFLDGFPYGDLTGLLNIEHPYVIAGDAFPTSSNLEVPRISIQLSP